MKAFLEALTPGDADWALAKALDPARLPEHIAIIMDGNGRWANRRSLPRVAGHKAGIGPVRGTVENCARLGIKALTLYAFSVENWKRPRAKSKRCGGCCASICAASCPSCRKTTSGWRRSGASMRFRRRCGPSSRPPSKPPRATADCWSIWPSTTADARSWSTPSTPFSTQPGATERSPHCGSTSR